VPVDPFQTRVGGVAWQHDVMVHVDAVRLAAAAAFCLPASDFPFGAFLVAGTPVAEKVKVGTTL